MKKNIVFISISLGLIMLLGIGFSYSLWNISVSQDTTNLAESKCFDLSITNQENNISLDNAYPISNDKGKSLTPYTFTVTNTCAITTEYSVNLEVLNNSTLASKFIDVMFEGNINLLSSYDNTDKVNTSSIESSSSEDENNSSSDVENTDYGKVTTIKERETNKQITQGDLSIVIKNVKILKYEAKDRDQLDSANFENVKNPYYVVQFSYDITNNSNKKLDLLGVSAVDVDSKELGQIITLHDNEDIDDADIPIRVNPGVTKTVTCQGLLKEDMLGSLNKLSVTFGEVEDKDYNTVTEEADPTSVDIN